MIYQYCAICGSKLKKQRNNLACTKCGFVNYRNPRPTVTGLVLYKNKLLLTKRARIPFKGWWDLPGGFVERGENAEEAILRELEEETGLKIKIKNFFGIYSGTFSSSFESFDILSIVYFAQGSGEPLRALDDVSQSKWFAKKEIPSKIAFDSNQKIIKDFLNFWK